MTSTASVTSSVKAGVASTVELAARRWRQHLGTRMPGRDRTWRGTHTIILLAGIEAPGAEALRATLRQLASLAPEHRIFRRPNAANTRWHTIPPEELDAFCHRMVLPLDHHPADDLDGLQKYLHDIRVPEIPLRLVTGRDFVAASIEHPLVDGRTILPFFAELVARADDGTPPLAMVRDSARWPLASAMADYWGREPRRLVGTLRTPRDTPPAEPPGEERRPWQPDFASASAVSDADLLPALRRWRARNARGVSRTAVFFAAARAALVSVGLEPSSAGLHVLADNRRYLPGRTAVDGNFSVGVYIEPDDPLDPASVGAALDTGLGAGRPLATMALLTARAQFQRPPTPAREARAHPRPSLVANYMGRVRDYEKLPWRDEGSARFLSASTPGHPEYITFMMLEMLGRLHVTAGFHASTFDPKQVGRAVQALCTDPVGLLESARVSAVG